MSRYLIVPLLLLLFSFPSVALGGDKGGFYYGGQFGANLMDNQDAKGDTGSFSLSPDAGGMASLLLGYDYSDGNPGLAQGRVELELSWRKNDLDTIEFSGGEYSADGDWTTYSALANFFFETHALKPLLAYYGVGLGWAWTSLNDTTVSGVSFADDKDNVFAWQLGAGLGYQVNQTLTIDCGYRYFATADPDFKDSRGRKFSTDLENHTVLLGARLLF